MARGMLKLTVLLMPRAYIRARGLVEGILNENVSCEIIFCGSKGLVDECNLTKFSDGIRFYENNTMSFESLLSILTDAKGEYVCFYDEICLDKQIRLQTQCNYLDNNREIDAVSCGYEILDGNSEAKANTFNVLGLLDLYKSDYFPYFSFVYRKSVLLSLISNNALQFMTFKSLYGLSRVLLAMFCMSKLKCGNIEDTLCSYNKTEAQNDLHHLKVELSIVRKFIYNCIKQKEDVVKSENVVKLRATSNKLSVCIAFLNEGAEVRNTVSSIRETVGNAVDVIVVNDASDDGYDYERDLYGLNVLYVKNTFRIGAAASKERAVQLSSTPFFLLLDAHMRFFDNIWHTKLVSELEKNSHRLVCCQTLVLKKDKNGNIVNKGEMGTYGAYFVFDKKDYFPQAKWNAHLLKFHGKEVIPGVLGASYASSVDYWNTIRGLNGLIHYGHEEPYISIKSWLEGGGCSIIPDIKIGHLFRDKFPYRTNDAMIIYNILLIDEVLLPTSLKCKAKCIALYKDAETYCHVVEMMEVRQKEIHELKTYYDDLRKNDFEDILSLNDLLVPEDESVIRKKAERLDELMKYVCKKVKSVNNVGLYNGKMLYVIIFCLYSKYSKDKRFENFASDLLESILNENLTGLPITMNNGLLGLGWGLLFLKSNKLLEDDITPYLNKIDEQVITKSLKYTSDKSISYGIGGVLAYFSARFEKKYSGRPTLPQSYMEELLACCDIILNDSSKVERRIYTYAMILKEINRGDYRIMPLQFDDLWSLPQNSPLNLNNINDDLTGSLGYVLYLLIMLLKVGAYEKE